MEKKNYILPKFTVMLGNDDVNSLDQVVALLILVVDMDIQTALVTALLAQEQGSWPIGSWHEEVAETIMLRLNESGLTVVMNKV